MESASNTAVLERNAIDPLLNTQQITSSLNFSKRYGWGTVTLGGNRRQSLSDGSVQQLLPALTISPASIALGSNITWSPGLSFTNNTSSRTPLDPIVRLLASGGVDTVEQTGSGRITAFNFETPLRFGAFNWQNSVQVTDEQSTERNLDSIRVDDPSTLDRTDSITVTSTFLGDFESGIDWDTGINLPILFRGSWKLQPVVGVANTTSGPFAVRNRNTGGAFVRQGKRFRFAASASPTLFPFSPGFGLASRVRHIFSPTISWTFSPAANVPAEYAEAITRPGQTVQLRSDATQTVSVGLSQTFEAKAKAAPGGTAEVPSSYVADAGRRNPSFYNSGQVPFSSGGRTFSANFNYTLSRDRTVPGREGRNQQNLGFSTGFSPTPFWSLSWSSQFNITNSKFESQVVRLERQLHEWRAGFNFVRNANGNFAFYFSVYLTDLPDLKFDYNQTTFEE